MASDPKDILLYKRSRFQTRLPRTRLYTQSHFWLEDIGDGVWRVGLTRFATRMLGEVVEQGFEVKPEQGVKVGQTIGWVEGFKAISDLYCVADGAFVSGNADLDADPTLVDRDPYYKGWLYLVRGHPDPNALAVDGYIQVLDATIDKMVGSAS